MSLDDFLWEPRANRLRYLLAAAAATSAVAHAIVIAPHLSEAPYMGLEFIVLTVACLLLGGAALVRDTAAVYALAIVTCGLAVVGYAVSRMIALPQIGDDVGNWFEPLGVVSVVSEVVAAVVSVLALRSPATVVTSPSFGTGTMWMAAVPTSQMRACLRRGSTQWPRIDV